MMVAEPVVAPVVPPTEPTAARTLAERFREAEKHIPKARMGRAYAQEADLHQHVARALKEWHHALRKALGHTTLTGEALRDLRVAREAKRRYSYWRVQYELAKIELRDARDNNRGLEKNEAAAGENYRWHSSIRIVDGKFLPTYEEQAVYAAWPIEEVKFDLPQGGLIGKPPRMFQVVPTSQNTRMFPRKEERRRERTYYDRRQATIIRQCAAAVYRTPTAQLEKCAEWGVIRPEEYPTLLEELNERLAKPLPGIGPKSPRKRPKLRRARSRQRMYSASQKAARAEAQKETGSPKGKPSGKKKGGDGK